MLRSHIIGLSIDGPIKIGVRMTSWIRKPRERGPNFDPIMYHYEGTFEKKR